MEVLSSDQLSMASEKKDKTEQNWTYSPLFAPLTNEDQHTSASLELYVLLFFLPHFEAMTNECWCHIKYISQSKKEVVNYKLKDPINSDQLKK